MSPRRLGTSIICFGEVLWDHLPAGRFLGGAPLNVAYHLTRLGWDARLVSAVGADEAGGAAVAAMASRGMVTGSVVSRPGLPTGEARATLDALGQARFTIGDPSAWDEIAGPPPGLVAPAIVFGTLALRRPANRETLSRWFGQVRGPRVCDVNLRAPHDDIGGLSGLIHGVDLLKVNADEARLLEPSAGGVVERGARRLAERFGARAVCVTMGADGALLLADGLVHRSPAPAVTVRDTVGAGDAFTAALVAGLLPAGAPDWGRVLRRACALGAFVASCDGAQPDYDARSVPGLA